MTSWLHCLTGLCLTATFLLTSGFMYGEPGDDSLRAYAVTVMQPPAESGGKGIYLGNGLVLTAAHVAGPASGPKKSVRFGDNLELPATFIKEGKFEQVDLTVLSVNVHELPADVRSRHLALCKDPPRPEDAVVVVTSEGTSRSKIIAPPPQLNPDFRRRFPTLISDVETDGKSGSGIFDPRNKCLLGIMSAKITTRPYGTPKHEDKAVGTYFVPVWTIESFIPSEYRL
jgi:Trypsin-like peptidase domain